MESNRAAFEELVRHLLPEDYARGRRHHLDKCLFIDPTTTNNSHNQRCSVRLPLESREIGQDVLNAMFGSLHQGQTPSPTMFEALASRGLCSEHRREPHISATAEQMRKRLQRAFEAHAGQAAPPPSALATSNPSMQLTNTTSLAPEMHFHLHLHNGASGPDVFAQSQVFQMSALGQPGLLLGASAFEQSTMTDKDFLDMLALAQLMQSPMVQSQPQALPKTAGAGYAAELSADSAPQQFSGMQSRVDDLEQQQGQD